MSDTEDNVRAAMMAEEIKRVRTRGPIDLQIDQFAAFQLVAALQLAWTHPALSHSMRQTIENFGRQLQAAFDEDDTPQLALTPEQGWHRQYDR